MLLDFIYNVQKTVSNHYFSHNDRIF